MGVPFISITTTGMSRTVIREATISPVLCMILWIEALKTQIDGQTLLKLKVATCRIITFSLPTRATCGSVLTNPFPKIAGIRWLQVAMWLISTCAP